MCARTWLLIFIGRKGRLYFSERWLLFTLRRKGMPLDLVDIYFRLVSPHLLQPIIYVLYILLLIYMLLLVSFPIKCKFDIFTFERYFTCLLMLFLGFWLIIYLLYNVILACYLLFGLVLVKLEEKRVFEYIFTRRPLNGIILKNRNDKLLHPWIDIRLELYLFFLYLSLYLNCIVIFEGGVCMIHFEK